MKILLVTSGSISSYLSDKLHSRYIEAGHEVTHLLTKNAETLWNAYNRYSKNQHKKNNQTFSGSIEDECLRHYRDGNGIAHIEFTDWADICVICPADFNVIGKMANGIADDLVSSTLAAFLGSGKPVYAAEAMNNMMYGNPVHLGNIKKLRDCGVKFIMPTVKKLACGSYAIGGLADIDAIFDLTTGYRWRRPLSDSNLIGYSKYLKDCSSSTVKPGNLVDYSEYLPKFNEPGAFGALRKFDRHEGVDIYCNEGSVVSSVEDGKVVDSYQYTGEAVGCGWWQDTWCIKVQGRSGVVTYGELRMPSDDSRYPTVGQNVRAGDFIGKVGTVLKNGKLRPDIRNHSMSMLHMELRTENCHLDGWKIDGDRNRKLKDPSPYLHLIDD